ncbi:hypothetical protein ACHAXA_008187 [Cyclostephanos tholiformis]|uniref:TIP41-like protein n=1 Tax=Cyclostephanos tholiformis TaxID=382380 RepID=A0ABD3SCB4_9STRA
MAPNSHSRRILPTQTLASFGATPIYARAESPSSPSSRPCRPNTTPPPPPPPPPPPTTTTTTTTTTTSSSADNDCTPEGIGLSNWEISTRNSSIGDCADMAELTSSLEDVANDDDDDDGGGEGDVGGGRTTTTTTMRMRRRLCPPEIAFLDAFILCRYRHRRRGRTPTAAEEGEDDDVEDDDDDVDASDGGALRLDARDALMEWAEAHRCMQLPSRRGIPPPTATTADGTRVIGGEGHRGVSIVRTADAAIWSRRSYRNEDDYGGGGVDIDSTTTTTTTISSGECEFYYDWTFSSPYAGTAIVGDLAVGERMGSRIEGMAINNRQVWRPLRHSRIPLHMLRDNTKPILLYDDVIMYEDDLHDNGEVTLSAKIRVMPDCWYVLQRLYVRVDRVCIRCREVRYFCSFDNVRFGAGDAGSEIDDHSTARANVIYRDVTWREATWGELGDAGMPTDAAVWRERDGIAAPRGGNSANGMPAPPPLASLLMRLPSVHLPDDIPRYSSFDVRQRI